MDPVHESGPWTRSKTGSMDPSSMFCPHPATGTLHPSSNRKAKTLWITKITRSITNLSFLRVGFLNQFYSQQSVWTPRNPCLSLTTY